MFWNLIVIEQQKLVKRAILWVELALMLVAVVAMNAMLFVILKTQPDDPMIGALQQTLVWPMGLMQSLGLASGASLGGILIVILMGAVVGQEYSWRTVQLWLSRGVPRPLFLVAKFTAVFLPALLFVFLPLVVGGGITAAFSQNLLGHVPTADIEWGKLLLTALATAYTLLPYAALAFLLAIATRSIIVTIGAGLAYTLLLEGIVVQLLAFAGGVWAEIGRYLPAGLAQGVLGIGRSMTVEVGGELAPAIQYLDPAPAAVGVALYTAVFIGLAILVFRRQDLGG